MRNCVIRSDFPAILSLLNPGLTILLYAKMGSWFFAVYSKDLTMIDETVFLLRPQNKRFLERETRRSTSGFNKFWIVLVLTGVFLLVLLGGVGLKVERVLELNRQGVDTVGIVVDHHVSGGDSVHYYLTYAFAVNDQFYQEEQQVSKDHYKAWDVGEQVSIRYLPHNPSTSKLDDETETRSQKILMTIVTGTLVLWLVVVCMGAWHVRYERRLNQGIVIRGEVLDCEEKNSGKRNSSVILHCRFYTPDGREMIKEERAFTNDLKGRLPSAGTPVIVLYADEKTYLVL